MWVRPVVTQAIVLRKMPWTRCLKQVITDFLYDSETSRLHGVSGSASFPLLSGKPLGACMGTIAAYNCAKYLETGLHRSNERIAPPLDSLD